MSAPISKADLKVKSFALDTRGDTVRVCAWCFPTDTIFNVFPHLRGRVAISHGICAEHKKRFLAELAAKKP